MLCCFAPTNTYSSSMTGFQARYTAPRSGLDYRLRGLKQLVSACTGYDGLDPASQDFQSRVEAVQPGLGVELKGWYETFASLLQMDEEVHLRREETGLWQEWLASVHSQIAQHINHNEPDTVQMQMRSVSHWLVSCFSCKSAQICSADSRSLQTGLHYHKIANNIVSCIRYILWAARTVADQPVVHPQTRQTNQLRWPSHHQFVHHFPA